jgi:pyridoxamine 5'-phosphate oxidase-like protein
VTPMRHRAVLTRAESLRLVGSVPFGRVVFTFRALPAVRPVSHLVDGGQIIIRASLGAAVSVAADGPGMVVAYEADLIDAAGRAGWSVAVVGRATLVAAGPLAARYRAALHSWLDEDADEVIAISADLVTGYRMTADPVPFPATT